MNTYSALALLAVGVLLIWLPSAWRLEQRWAAPPSAMAASPGSVERGRHLAESVTLCGHCHGADLGGAEIVDMALFGRVWAPNLTRPSQQTDFATWRNSVLHGVDADGRTLIAMPSDQLGALRTEDLRDIWAYLESLPPVEREIPSRWIGLLPRFLFLFGRGTEVLSAEHAAARTHAAPPPPGPTAAYGAHLARVGLCHLCHHESLEGGLHPLALPEEPPPADLRPGGSLAGWSRADFGRAMKAGITPDGRHLDAEYMPWPRFAGLSEMELDALWAFLNGTRDETNVAAGAAP